MAQARRGINSRLKLIFRRSIADDQQPRIRRAADATFANAATSGRQTMPRLSCCRTQSDGHSLRQDSTAMA